MKPVSIVSIIIGVLMPVTNLFVGHTVNAQAQDVCDDPGVIAPTDETRSLELSQFGVNLTIPANFRAILRNDGSVQIVDPGTFELLQCIARGGEALGRGYSSTTIRSVEMPENQELQAFVEQQVNNSRSPDRCISPYPLDEQRGYLVQSEGDRTAEFWINPETVADVTVISTRCDCEGMTEKLVNLLDRSSLMNRE